MSAKPTVQVGERELTLSNLDKVLYPATGTTKAEVIELSLIHISEPTRPY